MDLSSNLLRADCDTCLTQRSFQGLASLIVLNLSHNHISRLQSGLFEDLANLQILDGSHNQIEQIPQGNRQSNKISKTCLTFKKLSSLKTGMSGMR